ncbi:protein male-specific lethal-1-like isoform X2 [Trichoplusia ni]|uniref:Protein male-specific lethal-1-like isoform X2 n=1 Tax=Trichoplusia ni TaxID=7111 RepID=A0A7E5VP77_TRINI|nr:protein male-specific lethal-1-like isoform X2 [Trichoplusia ni]
MNSRSSVNESNLVNLSGDLSTLNQLDTKESLALSFPFDHLYACHSESSDRQEAILDKEVEIPLLTDDKELVATGDQSFEVSKLSERLTQAEKQNKRLKSLLLYHLDLIQQQNELITNKDKVNSALRLENDSLKSKVNRMDRRITVGQRHSISPLPLAHVPPSNVNQTVKLEPSSTDSQMCNTLSEFLIPDSRTNRPSRTNPYVFNNEIPKIKPYVSDSLELNRIPETDVVNYLPGDIGGGTILDPNNLQRDNFGTMIENKRSFVQKEIKTESRPEPLYTVTSNSGNTVIQKIQRSRRRTSGGLGSLSRLPKAPPVKPEPAENANVFEDDKSFERSFSVNKKSKMINTYGKSKTSTVPKKTPHFTGSLSDRLQLIDTTPTGEDPYQLGEADMREQSPIPKLMLQKTNHGRMKICSDTPGESTRRTIYDAPATETSTKMPNKIRLEKRYNLPNIIPYTVTQTSTHTTTHSITKTHASTLTTTHTSTHTTILSSPHTVTRTSTHTSSYKSLHKNLQAPSHKASHSAMHKGSHSAQHKASHSPLNKFQQPVPLTNTFAAPAAYTPTTTATHTAPESITNEETSPLSPIKTPLQQTNLEQDINWRIMSASLGNQPSMCDFSYGENSNLTTPVANLDLSEFRKLFEVDPTVTSTITLNNMNTLSYEQGSDTTTGDKTKKRGARTTSLMSPSSMEFQDPTGEVKRGMDSKRGRKRALSTAGLTKNAKQNFPKPVGPKPRTAKGKAACRGKNPPVPGMMTRKLYHTQVGDPDVSWYLGLDPDVKIDDIDATEESKASTVEVPRWREKPYTSSYTMEGTENLDDKVFEKRHQKLEAEERRQLRWHMRRIREQRHVERLRLRQRDPWYSGPIPYQPSMYTIWPQPQRDVRMIEITDTIPVMAFGENIPDLPRADFMLPWVRTSKALKRSKRSKTLH